MTNEGGISSSAPGKIAFRASIDTANKLDCLRQYLQAYSIALRDRGFARLYIDAFAGTGSATEVRAALPLFGPEFAEPQRVDTPGSARIALSIEPAFDTIALIELDESRVGELERLKSEFPDRKVIVKRGDANASVRRICEGVPWHEKQPPIAGMRGVVFLDPFGMEVEWSTVEAIAKTEALDCWYFFPLAGLYRNAPHDPARLDATKEAALDRVLGTKEWRSAWYQKVAGQSDMFESTEDEIIRADIDGIERFVAARLRSVFRGLVMPPLRLRHNGKAPMASLFFAVSNTDKKAVALARRISSHILTGSSSHVRSR
jgi:three-Cys-motif partner protein